MRLLPIIYSLYILLYILFVIFSMGPEVFLSLSLNHSVREGDHESIRDVKFCSWSFSSFLSFFCCIHTIVIHSFQYISHPILHGFKYTLRALSSLLVFAPDCIAKHLWFYSSIALITLHVDVRTIKYDECEWLNTFNIF